MSSARFESESSITAAGCISVNSVRIGGRISAPMTSVVVMRMTPVTDLVSPLASLSAASAAEAMFWMCGFRSLAKSVGFRPWGERVNSGRPRAASSCST